MSEKFPSEFLSQLVPNAQRFPYSIVIADMPAEDPRDLHTNFNDPDVTRFTPAIITSQPLTFWAGGEEAGMACFTPVDAGLELRSTKVALLNYRMTYPQMQALKACAGMQVFVIENYTALDGTFHKSGLYQCYNIDDVIGDLAWMRLAGDGESSSFDYRGNIPSSPLQITGFNARTNLYTVSETGSNFVKFEDNVTPNSVLKYSGRDPVNNKIHLIGITQAAARIGTKSLGAQILDIEFKNLPRTQDAYSYVTLNNISEISFADYATLSIASPDAARTPHAFLKAWTDPDFEQPHEEITTVIYAGNAHPKPPTTLAATLELQGSDVYGVCSFLTGRMDESLVGTMFTDFIADDFSGLSWYNTTTKRYQLVYDQKKKIDLIPQRDNPQAQSISIGDNSNASGVGSIAIGYGSSAPFDGQASFSPTTKLSLGDISKPSSWLNLGGGDIPAISFKPASLPQTNASSDYLLLDSNREFKFVSTDSNNQPQLSTLKVGMVKSINVDTSKLNLFANDLQKTVQIKAPDSLTQSFALTLPESVGSAGQMLLTNGDGNLSWGTSLNATVVGTPNQVDVLLLDPQTAKVSIANNAVFPGDQGVTIPNVTESQKQSLAGGLPGTIRFVKIDNYNKGK